MVTAKWFLLTLYLPVLLVPVAGVDAAGMSHARSEQCAKHHTEFLQRTSVKRLRRDADVITAGLRRPRM